jgi:CRP-like cAMP-binding protein
MSHGDKVLDRYARELAPGSVLFREGEPGTRMYVIRSGRVRLSMQVRDAELTLAVLGPGEFFGEMSILNQQPRSATATVVEPAELLEIEPRVFETMVRANTEIAVRMIQRLAARLAAANHQIQTLLLKDHVSRVASHLLFELRAQGLEYGKVAAARSALLEHTGLSEPELTDALTTLSRLGLVMVNAQGGLSIPDGMALANFLESPVGRAEASPP